LLSFIRVAAIAAAFAFPATSPAQQSTLRGRAFDAYSGSPLASAAVASDAGASVQTGTDGRFTLPCAGAVTLTIRRAGYEPLVAKVASCADFVQAALTPAARALNEVTVVETADAPGAASLSQPMSVSSIGRAELRRSTGLFADDAFNQIPGVRFERRTMSGGQRITIRGYGNRTNFDGSGYKAYLNGIPLTDAEGVTQLDDVDWATLGRVNVVRGPASSLFGAGIGGVVNLYTLRPEQQGTTIEQEVLAGQDAMLRADTRLASRTGNSSYLLNYGRQRYGSYRVHSDSRKDFATFIGDFRPSEERTVTTYLGYAFSRDRRAGQLDSAQFFGRQNAGEPPYLANDAAVKMESLRGGVTHAYRHSDIFESVVTGFFNGVTREDIFAVGVNPKSAQTFGGRAVLNARFIPEAFGGRPLTGVIGGEYQKTNAAVQGFRYTNAVLGAPTNDLETATQQASLFTQWDVALPADVVVTAGTSVNFIEYALRDRLANTANPTRRSVSGRKVYDPVVIPRVAFRKTFSDVLSAYASLSQGFTPSTSSDAVIAFTGQANSGLKPEQATQLEIGTKGSLFDRRLAYQLAVFDLRVTDKLTSQTVFDTNGGSLYSYTVNAGNQRNRGLELSAGYALVRTAAGPVTFVRPFVSYAYSDFTFTDFKSNANNNAQTIDYTGNRVPGVPRNVWTGGVDVGTAGGGYGNLTFERREAMPLTFDNAHEAPGYTVLNAKVGAVRDVGDVRIDAYVGGQNLTGALYYTMAFLNGNYSGAPPAVFLPGPYNARFFGGVKIGYVR
jgi:iron complex outermembrane receptor protein